MLGLSLVTCHGSLCSAAVNHVCLLMEAGQSRDHCQCRQHGKQLFVPPSTFRRLLNVRLIKRHTDVIAIGAGQDKARVCYSLERGFKGVIVEWW